MPKIIAITGYYNRRELLPITINSLSAQTYEDFKVRVFDDASTDGTVEAFEQYNFDKSLVSLVANKRNKGFTNTLIENIENTDSKYIAIVGSGDYCYPRRLEAQARVLDENDDIVLVGSHFRTVFGNGRSVMRRPNHSEVDLQGLLRGNGISHGEVMFRRSSYSKVGGYRPGFKFSPDYDLWLRLIKEGRFHTVPELLYDRHVQLDGASYSPEKFSVQARYAMLSRILATTDREDITYDRMVAEGAEALVPLEDVELQRRLVRGSVRNFVMGDLAGARAIADRYVVSVPTRTALLTLFGAADNLVGRVGLSAVRLMFSRAA